MGLKPAHTLFSKLGALTHDYIVPGWKEYAFWLNNIKVTLWETQKDSRVQNHKGRFRTERCGKIVASWLRSVQKGNAGGQGAEVEGDSKESW